MGRKIPGKKHKGVKDPEKQRVVRQNSIKNKINIPPSNPDDQAVPKSLQKLIDFKKRINSGQVPEKRKRNKSVLKGLITTVGKVKSQFNKSNSQKAPANFTQLPGESNRDFLHRVNQTVQTYLQETNFENKFGVDIKRSENTGEIIDVQKRPKAEFDALFRQSRQKKLKNIKLKTNSATQVSRLTKSQKKTIKIAEKKEKKELSKLDEFEKYSDEVKFGEIVHAPPSLSVPKKVLKQNGASRPGKKDLLLKTVIAESAPVSRAQSPVTRITIFKKVPLSAVDRKGKRKELPVATRRQLEQQQEEVVNAYRQIKNKKRGLRGDQL